MPNIVDQYGNPIDLGRLAEPQTADTAWLRREYDTHPAKGLTPTRLAQILLAGEQGDLTGQLDLADDIVERDGHAYAELDKRSGSIAALEWDVVPPDGASAQEAAWAEQLGELLRAVPDFEDLLGEMMEGVLKGFAAHAITWVQDGRIRMPRLEYVPQRWLMPDPDRRGLLLRSQTAHEVLTAGGVAQGVMGEPLRPLAWLLHTPRARNGYRARQALARVLAWPYLYKHYSVRDLAEFLEIYGLPLRLGHYPSGASPDEKRTLLRAVTEIGHNAAGIIPAGMSIDFAAAAEGSDQPFLSFARYMDAVESKVILGQTLSASEGQHGTQALGLVHEQVRMDIRAADARQIEGTITNQLLVPMGIINIAGFDPKRAPRFKLDTSQAEDLKLYADALPKLVGLGMAIPADWAHEKLRIPQADGDQPVLRAAAATASQPAPAEAVDDSPPPTRAAAPLAGAAPAAATTAAAAGPARDVIDEMVDEQAARWQPLLGPLISPLLAELDRAVAAGESLQAFAARLPALVAQMDATPLADDLARASFAARLAGEADLGLTGPES